MLSGRHIRADEALRIGLVQAVFPKVDATNAAADITTGQGIERDLFAQAFTSEDQSEGMAAFLEKRAPELSARRSCRPA